VTAAEGARDVVNLAARALQSASQKGLRVNLRRGTSECPLCRKLTLTLRTVDTELLLLCSNGCVEADIAAALDVPLWGGSGGSRTGDEPAEPGVVRVVRTPIGGEPPNRVGTLPADAPLWEPLAEFLARAETMPDPSWLIPDLVPDYGRLLVVAEPNAGKTFLALVVAKAAGECGRPSFLVFEEGPPKPMANRMRALRLDPTWPIQVAHLRGLTLAGGERHLCAAAASHDAPVLVLDPWVSIAGDVDENDTAQMAATVAIAEKIPRTNPKALLTVCHHANRSGARGEGSRAMASRGSTTLPAWADVVLYLEHVSTPRGSGHVAFDATVAKNRDGTRDYTIRVTISLGDGTVAYEHTEKSDKNQRRAEERTEQRTRDVVALVKEASKPLSKRTIRETVGGESRAVGKLVDDLVAQGVLFDTGDGFTCTAR
jgi:hypothetical protein